MRLNSPKINIMYRACMKASKSLIRDFVELEKLQVSKKGPGDFLSAADKKSEKIIIQELTKSYPDYSVLSEELGEINKSEDDKWIVDPIDGTTNFLNGIPQFAISIAYEHKKEVMCGIIFDPIKNEIFCAEKGQGSYLNNSRIRVSNKRRLEESILVTGGPKFNSKNKNKIFDEYFDISKKCNIPIRKFGSASLDMANVACGRFDGYWQWELNYWDIAAGIIIVKEAGGFVDEITESNKSSNKMNIIATNSQIHEELLSSLSKKILSKIKY